MPPLALLAGGLATRMRPLTEKIPALLAFDEIVGSAPDFTRPTIVFAGESVVMPSLPAEATIVTERPAAAISLIASV